MAPAGFRTVRRFAIAPSRVIQRPMPRQLTRRRPIAGELMEFRDDGGRPGDERGFIHKKILGGIATVAGIIPVPGAQIVSGVARRLSGGQAKEQGKRAKLNGGFNGLGFGVGAGVGGCPEGFAMDARGFCKPVNGGRIGLGCRAGQVWSPALQMCVTAISPLGARELGQPVMGRYGAGVVAGSRIVDIATCPKKMHLGDDGICYSKSLISNKQRMWPKGRKPLLTGGELGAIATAASAGKRLDTATKRLRKMGMMKPLPTSRKAPATHAHAVPVAAVSVN